MSFAQTLAKISEELKKITDNPIVDHGIDWLGDFLMGQIFIKHHANNQTTRTLNPEWLRKEAPRLYARTSLDENLLREITYSRHFKAAYRVALFDNWGPNPAVTEPDPLLGEIGAHQWDDFRLNLVDALFSQSGPAMTPLSGAEREAKIQELCVFLTEIAQLPDVYKLRRLVQLRFCRSRETDYKIVKFERFRRRTFATIQDLAHGVEDWINDPSPNGYRALAQQTADDITDVTNNTIRPALDSIADALNNRANQINAPTSLTVPILNIFGTRVGGQTTTFRGLSRFIR